ncbi:thiamine phosphate synthase [Rufibacter immobilis]|uniref:thiamine phosphate synthase n=1 Tax=Rufibacter immobilis TaxID=1348778 RepID=UPI0035EF6F02
MSFHPFQIVVVTPDIPLQKQAGFWRPLLEAGADYLYLRSPIVLPEEKVLLRDLLDHGYADRLILPMASAGELAPGGAGYRHVKEWERINQEQEYKPGVAYSTSVHALADLPHLQAAFKMVFYSPLFPSISKEGYRPSAELSVIQEEWQTLKAQSTSLPKVIGLGGITAANIPQIKQASFDGAALLGAVWQAPNPVHALRSIKAALTEV